ncbi:Kinesin-4 [Diplonema papillatum]|nr:Kinesin-4 [Diplonema papillatum]|eukprot:gene20244-31144_t
MAGGKEHVVVEVMYPYSAAENNQISLHPTERITVLEKDKSGWWIGKRGTGEVGIFPSTYVRVVEERLKFNRPKELKQLPLASGGGGQADAKRNPTADRERKMRSDLGFDSDSADEKDPNAGERYQKLKIDSQKMRRQIESYAAENKQLRDASAKAEQRHGAEVSTMRTQINVLKRQLAADHEKERRLLLELDDWKLLSQENDQAQKPEPRKYTDEPDEALQRWLDNATQDKLKDAEETAAKLKAQIEQLTADLARARSDAGSADDDALDLPQDNSEASPKAAKKPSRHGRGGSDRSVSPRPGRSSNNNGGAGGEESANGFNGERPDKHDVVIINEKCESVDVGGCLKPGEQGTVVEDQGKDSPMPFRVRNAEGVDSWYTEDSLTIVARGKRKAGAVSPPPQLLTAGNDGSAKKSDLSEPSGDAAALHAELKDKTKRLKKMEKKQQVLEEDLEALEKYNTKLEKKLEKEKAKKTEGGGGGGGGGDEAMAAELAELREALAKAEKKAKKEKKERSGGASPTPDASGGTEGAGDPSSAHDDALLREKIAAAEAERDSAFKELEAQKAAVQALEAELAAFQQENSAEKTAALAASLQAAQDKAADLEASLMELEVEKAQLLEKAASLASETEQAKAGMAQAVAEKNAACDSTAKLKEMAETAQRKMEEQSEQLTIAVEKYKKEEKRRRKLYNELIELKGNIRVFCRVKPTSDPDVSIGLEDDMTVKVKDPNTGKVTIYEFDKCFEQEATQTEVFEEARPLAVSVLDGYYVCIFAYGQTGSGKTYTMEGPSDNRGVNFRTVSELFKLAQDRSDDYMYELSVSVLEVYNDKIYDLQNKRTPVKVTPGEKGRDCTITPLTKVPVTDTEQVVAALATAYESRKVAGTSMNEHSSRSHCVLSVWVTATNKGTKQSLTGKLHLVDLAGSERLAKSEAEGEQRVEATHINKSLTQLGLCINSLANKKDHIPYRNSQLTTLLQDSLGGNCKVLMFANISPLSSNVGETGSTLKFATNAMKVEMGKITKNVK